MRSPAFTAEACFDEKDTYRVNWRDAEQSIVPSARFGGFGPTLPTCRWVKRMVVCGSALPGYPVPMCPEW